MIQQVIDAHRGVDEAKKEAARIIHEAKLARARAIRAAREQEVEQLKLADALGTNRENLRLWEKVLDKK
ncbi:hypothetical protein KGD82_16775 [Nocardiopsis eucommiae]|uniref:Uncharacterized protein n=1 Tax=Nocardiopsis eucommiae TaxID=2831970 RepID=A0A975L7M2_9ACTN|nr:hypothetical protein KGD82_16775 [Nocardiopsis eucommiae]